LPWSVPGHAVADALLLVALPGGAAPGARPAPEIERSVTRPGRQALPAPAGVRLPPAIRVAPFDGRIAPGSARKISSLGEKRPMEGERSCATDPKTQR
jgi:hypothetical protein